MSHSGNQGPDWFFGIIGRQNSRAGVARFVVLLFIVLLVLGIVLTLV